MTRLNFEDLTCSWGSGSFSKISGMYIDCAPSEQSGYDSNLWYMVQVPSSITSSGTITLNDGTAFPSKGYPYNSIYVNLDGGEEGVAYYQPFDPSELGPILYPRSWNSSVTCSTRRPFFIKRKKTAFNVELAYGINIGDIPDYLALGAQSAKQTCPIPAIPSYAVTYNANGGSGAPSSQTKWYAESLTLSSTAPTYSGYSFKRWNTNSSDTGTAYSPGAAYTGNAALSLYAIWNRTITYNANGGSGAPSSQTNLKSTAITIPATIPTRSGWEFTGWNTASDGSGTSYSAGGTYAANLPNVTLYAQWKRIITNVKINGATAIRVDSASSTVESDEGEYARISVPYSVEGAAAADVSLSITVTADSGTVPTITMVDDSDEKDEDDTLSGTFLATAYVCSTDVRYHFAVTVTAENTSATQTDVTKSETLVLATAFFTIDFLAGGHGVGIGKSATQTNLLDIGMDTNFDGAMKANGENFYPMFTKTSWNASSSIASLPTTPCYILSESDKSLWYCNGTITYPIKSFGTHLPGVIYPFSGTTVPDGFLLCDGSAVSRTTYAELFQVIGTTYGSGDGSTTFNVPDLRGRTAIGASSGHAMGTTGGEESHTLTVDEMPSHGHGVYAKGFAGNLGIQVCQSGQSDGSWYGFADQPEGSHYSSPYASDSGVYADATGGGQAHNNMQPFATVNYIISTGQGGGVSVEEVIQGITTFPLDIQYGGTGANTAAGAPWVQKSGDTMTGTLRAPIYESKTQLPSIYGGAPSSSSYSPISSAQDASNDTFWYSEGYHGADDYTGYNTVAYRKVSGSDVYLSLLMAIGPTGWRHAELGTDNFVITGRAQVNGSLYVNSGEIKVKDGNYGEAGISSNSEGGNVWWAAPDGSWNEMDSWNTTHTRIYSFYQNSYHAVTWERGRDYDLNQIYDRSLPLWGGTLTGRLAINANGVKSWFGSANNGWVHFTNDQGKPNYFEQEIHCAGDFFIYNTSYVMLRTENHGDRINYMNRANDYLHISTWNYGNYGVTWWSSDIRLKENIENSEVDALEVVNQIQHRSFDMKSDGEHHDIGYIAQELEKLDPQMVTKVYQSREVNGRSYFTGDYQYQIDERKVIPYLSRSIQQLSEENEELKAKNAELEERLAAIEERLGL